jgi:hypothetical protein
LCVEAYGDLHDHQPMSTATPEDKCPVRSGSPSTLHQPPY